MCGRSNASSWKLDVAATSTSEGSSNGTSTQWVVRRIPDHSHPRVSNSASYASTVPLHLSPRSSLRVLVLVVVGAIVASTLYFTLRPSLTPEQIEQARLHALYVAETAAVQRSNRLVNVTLPKKANRPAPATPTVLFKKPLARHQVVGFVPYWALGSLSSSELADSSVLVYSALCVNGKGGLDIAPGECTNEYNDLNSSLFSNFVEQAHAAGDRVLLSAQSIDAATIHSLVTHYSSSAKTLSSVLGQIVHSDGLDGIDLDIEGQASADREGYVHFVRAFAADVHASAPDLELTVDTYPQSAGDSKDFYDVAQLHKYANYLLVMAYQEEDARHSSANSPLASPDLGWSAVQTLMQYAKVVPRSKTILLLPFYGLQFVTKSANSGALLAGDGLEEPLYEQIAAAGHPAKWDLGSGTPFAAFKVNGKWQQIWYDDPVSIALKTALAASFHIAGVGVWALTMEGSDTQMLNALTGNARVVKLPLATAG